MQSKIGLKNDQALKTKKFHMKSILCEVKNKSLIDEIQNEMQLNYSVIANTKGKLKNKSQLKQNRKDSFIKLTKIKQANQDLEKQQTINIKQKDKVEHPQSLQKNQNENKFQRRSSKLQLQLDQIIKYSKLYPGRKSSEKQIQENINKLVDTKVLSINQKYAKSKFSIMTHQHKIQQNIDQENNQNKNQMKQQLNSQSKKNIVLKLIQDYGESEVGYDAQRKKKIKFLIKKSHNLCNRYKQEFDYSLEGFIQNQLSTARVKKGRKTVGFLSKQKNKLDLRDQLTQNMHTFIRGQYREDIEFSNHLNSKQIQSFRTKYSLYNSIYKKTKEAINNQKMNISEMKALTFKNAVYLNEVKHQSNGKYKKNQVSKAMQDLQFCY